MTKRRWENDKKTFKSEKRIKRDDESSDGADWQDNLHTSVFLLGAKQREKVSIKKSHPSCNVNFMTHLHGRKSPYFVSNKCDK